MGGARAEWGGGQRDTFEISQIQKKEEEAGLKNEQKMNKK